MICRSLAHTHDTSRTTRHARHGHGTRNSDADNSWLHTPNLRLLLERRMQSPSLQSKYQKSNILYRFWTTPLKSTFGRQHVQRSGGVLRTISCMQFCDYSGACCVNGLNVARMPCECSVAVLQMLLMLCDCSGCFFNASVLSDC